MCEFSKPESGEAKDSTEISRLAGAVERAARNLVETAVVYELLWLWNHRLLTAMECCRRLHFACESEEVAASRLQSIQDRMIERRSR